jgi:hypothetical protein
MLQTWSWFFFRWFPVLAVSLVAVIFLWRRLWRELPFFFLYLASAMLVGVVRYGGYLLGRRANFYSYWISDLAMAVVAFLPMYEVFLRRLFAGFHKNRFYRNIFPLVAATVLLLAVLTAWQAQDKGAAFQMASRAFDFMRTAVLVFFIGLMLLMGRDWTRYDLGITLGFAIQAAVALASAAVRASVHYQPTLFDTVERIVYDLSCLIWLITFWKPEKRTQFVPAERLDPAMLHEARTWETQLKDWLIPGKSKRS